MNESQRTRLEMIASGAVEPDNELELLFVEAAKKGNELVAPLQLYTALVDRFPEIKSDEVEAMILGYDMGIVAGAASQMHDEEAMIEAMGEFLNKEKDDKGYVQ